MLLPFGAGPTRINTAQGRGSLLTVSSQQIICLDHQMHTLPVTSQDMLKQPTTLHLARTFPSKVLYRAAQTCSAMANDDA